MSDKIKENFRDIQFRQTSDEAVKIFMRWNQAAKNAKIPEITTVSEMFERHMKGTVNAIETGANNARAERLNGSIQELKAIGRGYRNTDNFITAIMFFHENLNLYSHKYQ